MRRKGPRVSEHSFKPHSIEEIGVTRLATIGAISLTWNSIEGAIDVALGLALEQPEPMWLEIASRMNGLEAKIDAIKAATKFIHRMPDTERVLIAHALGMAMEYKRYRDAVIHAKVLDPSSPVAPTTERKGKVDEVLITKEALVALYKRLGALLSEVDILPRIFGNLAIAHGRLIATKDAPANDKRSAARQVKSGFLQLQALQQNRTTLPPLPRFPDERPTHPNLEAPKEPPG